MMLSIAMRWVAGCLLLASAQGLLLAPHGVASGAAARHAVRCGAPAMKKAAVKSKVVTVLLEADVEGLGVKGALVEVKPAYAENVLVNQGKGSIASQEMIDTALAEAAAALAKKAGAKKRAAEGKDMLQSKLSKSGLTIEVQVDKQTGEILESVTTETVAAAIKRAGVEVVASDISMPEITELGSVIAEVALHPEVTASVKVVVEKSKIPFS